MPDLSPDSRAAWEALDAAREAVQHETMAAALPALLKAVQGFRRAKDYAGESHALALLAGVHNDLGNFSDAAKYRRAGLEAARTLSVPGTRIAGHLDGLGIALSNMGHWQDAETVYREALEACRQPVRELRALRGCVLKHLADVYLRYAEKPVDAIAMYDEAIAISRDCGDQFNLASALLFKGQALDSVQRPEDALKHYEQAKVIAEARGDEVLMGGSYAHLAEAYLRLNDLPIARQYVELAIAFDERSGNKQAICRNLWLLGRICQHEGNEQTAWNTLQRALLIAQEIHDRRLAIYILIQLARLTEQRLQGGKAKIYYEQALAYAREIDDRPSQIEIGIALAAHEDRGSVFSKLDTAIADARERGHLGTEQNLEQTLAEQYQKQGDLVRAKTHYVRAAELLERMRSGYTAEEHLRAFSEAQVTCFESLIDVCLQLGEHAEAFKWTERSRARVAQFMRQNRTARAALDLSPALERRYRQLRDDVIDLDRQIQRLERNGEPVPDATQERLAQALVEEATQRLNARRDSSGAAEEVPKVDADPDQLRHRLRELPMRVVTLAYHIGNAGVSVFCCDSDSFQVRRLGGGLGEVREQVRQFRASLGVPEVDARDEMSMRDPVAAPAHRPLKDHTASSRALYELLLRPVQAEISGADHVCIIPHGPLHFLPFHALHDGTQHLIETCAVSYAPSATILIDSFERPRVEINQVFALGEPATDLRPLPYSRTEVTAIQELVGADRCRVNIGQAATRAAVLTAGSGAGPGSADDFWHFAMHAMFVQSAPHLSYLQLAQSPSEDGRLFAYEIASLNRVAPVNVLSACRTAMSRESRGDEIHGLLFAFLVAGAQAVLATLWSVSDESTANLMGALYQDLGTGQMNLAKALRHAQIALLKNPRTSSPYYWAPVTLHCNWNPEATIELRTPKAASSTTPSMSSVSVDVLMRRADSLMARAKIAREQERLSWLPEAERTALAEAIDAYSQVLRDAPNHAAALRQRGTAYYALQETDRARSDLQAARQLDDADPVAAAMLGLIYSRQRGHASDTVSCLERAFALNQRLEIVYPTVRTHFLQSPLWRARAQLEIDEHTRQLANTPEDAGLYVARGQAYWRLAMNGDDFQADRQRSIQDFDRALSIDQNNALAMIRRAWIENPGEGPASIYEQAVRIDPTCGEAHLWLAHVIGASDADRAIAEYHEALACDPTLEHVHCYLAKRYLDQGDLQKALSAFETEVQRDPNCFDSYLYLTQIYVALGRRDDGLNAVRESIRTGAHRPHEGGPGISLVDSVVYAIRVLARQMKLAGSAGLPTLSTQRRLSLYQQANSLANGGRIQEAVDVYSEIIRHDPGDARAHAYRGGCYGALKDAEKATADLERSTELDPNDGQAWYNLSVVYFNQMRFVEARTAKERARSLDPETVQRYESSGLRRPEAQKQPFDLHSALGAAYRESAASCAHCGQRLRRPLGTQFAIDPDDVERVREGIPHFCHICGVNACASCLAGDGLKCRLCGSDTENWGEGKAAVSRQPVSGPCTVCESIGPLRVGNLCEDCYASSGQALSLLNYQGRVSDRCATCNAEVPVQLGEVFISNEDELQCGACRRQEKPK